jgi:hypothetical protein
MSVLPCGRETIVKDRASNTAAEMKIVRHTKKYNNIGRVRAAPGILGELKIKKQ